jgi:hypothetical protein
MTYVQVLRRWPRGIQVELASRDAIEPLLPTERWWPDRRRQAGSSVEALGNVGGPHRIVVLGACVSQLAYVSVVILSVPDTHSWGA